MSMSKPNTIADSVALQNPEPVVRKIDPRQRAIMTGTETLSDADLVAIVLGTGGGGMPLATLAASLVEDGVGALTRVGIGELSQRPGIGLAKAARLAAAVELGRHVVEAASLEGSPRLPARGAFQSGAAVALGFRQEDSEDAELERAETRLRDWRDRGAAKKPRRAR
jgi:DNA repair protein RadC